MRAASGSATANSGEAPKGIVATIRSDLASMTVVELLPALKA